jgi:peptidoglycan/LPS O-acetylase OafA/YrhL
MMTSTDVNHLGYGTSQFLLLMALDAFYSWTLILAILGFGMRHLDIKHPVLAYANEAVLPFYILHQPVILMVGYFVIPTSLSILAKYLTIALLSLVLSVGLYEFVIRRVGILRPLFGLKPAKAPALEAGKSR